MEGEIGQTGKSLGKLFDIMDQMREMVDTKCGKECIQIMLMDKTDNMLWARYAGLIENVGKIGNVGKMVSTMKVG